MKKRLFNVVLFCLACIVSTAQDRLPTSNMWLKAYPVSELQIPYEYDGKGTEYNVAWGMDVAWNWDFNVVRGTNYIGKDRIRSGRISFQPSDLVGDGYVLSAQQQFDLRQRINNIKLSGATEVILNCDHEALNRTNYYGKPQEWFKVIKASVLFAESEGLKVVSILPFNEPDYTSWGEGSQSDFKEIARLCKSDPDLKDIRICGGNTLNCDRAWNWYNYMKPYIDEGNTHQLAGSLANYKSFFQRVRNDGNYATADELHNSMEAFIAIHYGMQTGIWWGYDGLARGDLCIATSGGGEELAYGENGAAWSAGCVYRMPAGNVEAFVGVSERQANKNRIDLIATDRDVYYEGYGPVRLYQQFLPGDGVYSSENQKNADKVIHIHSGDDVPDDTIGGKYIIMNKKSKKIIAPVNTNYQAQVNQKTRANKDEERWNITPVSHLQGGDFSFYHLKNVKTNYYMNLRDNSLKPFGTFITYNAGGGQNEQYAFEYAGDGWYYMRNHVSGLYIESSGTSTVRQNVFTGKDDQKWRLMAPEAPCELVAPAVPTGLRTTPSPASVVLSWNANTERDMKSYIVLRGHLVGDEMKWETIGRRIEGTCFIDNSCEPGLSYEYKIKAVDLSGNRSEACEAVSGAPIGENCLLAEYEFDDSLIDNTVNQFDAASLTTPTYITNSAQLKSGNGCLNLNGSNYLAVPPVLGNLKELTISTWFYNSDVNQQWARLFDFGNGTNQYMFFTPRSGNGDARFVLKNGGSEQMLTTEAIQTGWKYITVTMSENEVKLYINGDVVASSTSINIRPSDFRPSVCFIGRSQFSADPLLKGRIDDFRIYNYALSQDEIKADMEDLTNAIEIVDGDAQQVITTEYYSLGGARIAQPDHGIFIMKQMMSDGDVRVKKIMK